MTSASDIIREMSGHSRKSATARVLLRLPADVHRSLTEAAARAGLSFNELCVRRLKTPVDAHGSSAARTAVVGRARALFADRLAGLIVLGSWARGEAAAGSDVDVLVIIDRDVELTRELYRRWDAAPLSVDGRNVDAHFAHAPEAAAQPTAVWCEAAVDGIVWYDRDGAIAMRLGEVRRAIAEGRVARAMVHGQPYWKGAA